MHRLNVDKLIRSTCIYRYFDCEIKYWYLEYLKGILHILNHPFRAYTSFKDHPDFTFANLVVFYINCASCNCKLLSKNSKVNGIDTKKRNTRVIRWYGCNQQDCIFKNVHAISIQKDIGSSTRRLLMPELGGTGQLFFFTIHFSKGMRVFGTL